MSKSLALGINNRQCIQAAFYVQLAGARKFTAGNENCYYAPRAKSQPFHLQNRRFIC